MGSQARKMRRAQERKITKRSDFVSAITSLKGLRPSIDDTQTAVVQVLGEIDNLEYQFSRQRAIFLRMVMEIKGAYAKKSFLVTNEMRDDSDPVETVMNLEEQYRMEYDAIIAIARGLMQKRQAEEAEAAAPEGP